MTTMKTRRDTESRSISEQAAEWLLILEDGRPEDREAFADWMKQSPLHVGAFLRASAVDSLLSEVDRDRSIEIQTGPFTDDSPDIRQRDPHEPDVELHETTIQPGHADRTGSPRPRWVQRKWQWAAAASVALVAIAASALFVTQKVSGVDPWSHYVTAVGEQRILELEDGSTLFLGPGSRLDVRFTPGERQLRLEAGEAMFRVRHDASRPFRVHSGGSVIQAIGTQFNVNRVRGDSVVSVIEGVVQISQDRSLAEKLVAPLARSIKAEVRPVRLAAGQETRIADNGKVAAPTRAEVDRLKAWRERRLTFINETLFTIAEEFNRYNSSPKIHVEDALAGDRRYAAAFDADDPESLVVVLEKDPKLQIEQRSGEIIIRGR
jgi:transmembrane sensor